VQVGDDNRAIEDFNYVLSLEPDNVMAIYNRAILLERTGDIYGAIRDYTKIIDQFPNFWAGLDSRARCYRKVGLTAKAELDEFKIFKGQMDKHYGRQQRWSSRKRHEVRKKSEIDFDKYNQLVVEDENTMQHEYSTAYRGRVQNRSIDVVFLPMFQLSFSQYDNGVKSYQAFDRDVESFNLGQRPRRKLFVRCGVKSLTEAESKEIFALIDTLSAAIEASHDLRKDKGVVLQRAVANSVVQNYADAISDLTAYIQIDSTSSLAYWQRAVCRARLNEYEASRGEDERLKTAGAISDIDTAIMLNPNNAYLYFDRGNLHAGADDYVKAIADYDKAIELDPNLAEAYYNRGIANIKLDKKDVGINDLSKAGELGLYDAYSAIKKFSKK
jgi:tetratricopeptide (TPR) repeat protein